MKREGIGKIVNALSLKTYTQTGKMHKIAQIKAVEEGSKNYTIDTLLSICEVLNIEITL